MSEKNFNIINAIVTFKNIPLHRLANFSFKDVLAAAEAFKKISDVDECVILQNPFRVEIFLVVNLDKGDVPDARRTEGQSLTVNQIQKTWTSLTELEQYDLDHFDQILEVYKANDVYLHLLRLASGLESLVVGREGILDEIKETITNAKQAKLSGNILNNLFDNCIKTATKIRKSTEISKGITSLGDVALKTIQDKTGIDGKKVLLVGTGEIAAMVARTLGHNDIKFDVTSMTIERATGFGNILGGTPVKFEDVLSGFDKYDIIIVATTADYFLISYDRIKRVMEKKKKGTMILDISNPRAVADQVSTLPGVKLMFRYQIDEMFEEYINSSKKKIPAVEEMITKEVPVISETIN
ncbi:MAG: glutamyl-tRNA reductase [Nitrosopumilaceae archaeon]